MSRITRRSTKETRRFTKYIICLWKFPNPEVVFPFGKEVNRVTFMKTDPMTANEISKIIIGCAIEVHKKIGPGLLESACHTCLVYELERAGLEVKSQVPLPLIYKDIRMDIGYRLDILVNTLVVVEVKSVESLPEVCTPQILTYLKLTGCELGLIINFNVPILKNGIKRVIRTNSDSGSELDLK